ncbi:hypothetical protein S40293_02180 [Stachybotrys chartarum IBT 40293]|nr:hypothetical protein S40293_02180 [Stachybotrys chartarum IBT 40293]
MASKAVALVSGPQSHSGPTLLPSPLAHAVSLAARSTSLAIRLGFVVSSYSLNAARFTTVSSLELARDVVEGVLGQAGRDNIFNARSELAASEAESILERSLESLHNAVSSIVFWTSAGFQLTNTSITAASGASQLALSFLDQLFGSTESSRAIASIITLIRREFDNPATGACGEKVGVIDLVVALSAVAYLQQTCKRTIREEGRRRAYEEVIWDVVVLDDGERVDVQEENAVGTRSRPYSPTEAGARSPKLQWQSAEDDETVFTQLKNQIAETMAPGTSVSVSSSVSTVQTITIDIRGPEPIPILPPPGAEIVEMNAFQKNSSVFDSPDEAANGTSYRVVYKIEKKKFRATSFEREDEELEPSIIDVTGDEDAQHAGPNQMIEPQVTITEPLDSPSEFSSPLSSPHSPEFEGDVSFDMSETPSTISSPAPEPVRESTSRVASHARRQLLPTKIPYAAQAPENVANEKRARSPARGSLDNSQSAFNRSSASKKRNGNSYSPVSKKPEKKNGIKQALNRSSQSLSNIWNKDSDKKPKPQWKTPGTKTQYIPTKPKPRPDEQPVMPTRYMQTSDPRPPPPRNSIVSVHERRRGSVVSQTDAYSMHSSRGLGATSPTLVRTEVAAQESLLNSPSPRKGQRRDAGSLYSLKTNDSQSSLVLSSYYQKSAYSAFDALNTLRREGVVSGTFPNAHLLHNITRYMRFSSASYGSHFLKYMGISEPLPILPSRDNTHHDVRHFVHHTQTETDNVLLASFVDPQGGSDSSGATGTGVPLVHYISLDHEAKAVVLVCRGTLGFEDVLADLACDYTYLKWGGRNYKVHKGIHASAQRLLYGGDGRVLVTLKEALREFPDFGLVMCGHSLGGAVASLLGVMLSEPNPTGTGFVTSSLQTPKEVYMRLPAGRRIHVYAYGPPGSMSRSLSKITRGLITSVVHGNDLVPSLSLGTLHDFQSVAASVRNDKKVQLDIRQRIWSSITAKVYSEPDPSSAAAHDDQDNMALLTALRATMKGEKLYPPGEVFVIETQRVLRRHAFLLLNDEEHLGQPAQRVVLKYVRDVKARFGEVRFAPGMLMDHNPAKYEDALNKLRLGVAD